ncbi:hypothetical protein Cni_G16885 [Canna indica]|uniref:F-box domain-containing protein n=1 Tax=Canna indica TaxID=4628 RepID=A0AAQ3KG15_9LILI|nr:hypothetical protein Cni_G16885 [Canna indica]
MEKGQLIPGLPEDVARECLSRVSFEDLSTVRAVCKQWKHSLDSPLFDKIRKSAGAARPVVALAQSEPPPLNSDEEAQRGSTPSPLLYRLSLFEPATGSWSLAPPIPRRFSGLPLFCQLVAIGRKLVVLGGWNSRTWNTSAEVHIYDLVSQTWRHGAPMPGPPRSFFACAAWEERGIVFVAGGHDESKDALRSALAYDMATNAWIHLPDMARHRDECRGVFAGGVFHVLGGYPTEAQAQFTRSAESFDVAAWRWGPVEEEKLEKPVCPRTSVVGKDGRLYMCSPKGQVVVLHEEGDRGDRAWRQIAELPGDVRAALQMVAWEGGMMVLGSGAQRGEQVAHILEMEGKDQKWRKVEIPREFSGHVQAACCVEI